MASVVHALDLEKSTVSCNLKRLIEHRWVSAAGTDRVLRLTPTGRRLVARTLPAWRQARRDAAVAIGADLIPTTSI